MPLIYQKFEADRQITYMHVMKCAGTSFLDTLAETLDVQASKVGFDQYSYGSFSGFETMSTAVRRSIFFTGDKMPECHIVGGHFSAHTLFNCYPDAQHITLMREPRSRLLSHWLYWRSHNDQALATSGHWADRVRLARGTLMSFISNELVSCQIDNVFTRALLWPDFKISRDSFIDRKFDSQIIEQALSRLAKFSYVDIIENRNLSSSFSRWFGRSFALKNVNKTEVVSPELLPSLYNEFTDACLDTIEERVRLDDAIWSHVAQQSIGESQVNFVRCSALMRLISRYAEMRC